MPQNDKAPIVVGNVSASEVVETRSQKKARLASVLERGLVGERLRVPLPPDVYGEWVPNDKTEIYRMQSLGYQVDTQYANKRALHDDGTDTAVVGDVIFMTIPMEDHELLEEVRKDKYNKQNNPKSQREDREVLSSLVPETPGITQSNQDAISGQGIMDTLKASD